MRVWRLDGPIGDVNGVRVAHLLIHQDEMYVADAKHHCVHVFALADGTHVRSWGSAGSGKGEFADIGGLAVAEVTRTLWVCDDKRFQIFS